MLYLSLGSILVFKVRLKNHKGQHCYHNDHIDDSDPSFFHSAFMRSFRGIMRFCGLFLILHDLGVVPLLHSAHGSKVTEQNIKEHDQ